MSRLASLLLIFLFGLSEPHAQYQSREELEKCTSIEEDTARLACFDAYATRARQQDIASSKSEKSQIEEIEAVDEELQQTELDPVDGEIERLETQQSQFGFPDSTSAKPEKIAPVRVVARVTTFTRLNRSNNIRITLDNGQIWQEIDSKPFRGSVEIGAEVTITKRRFGGYRMSVPGRSSAILVRRLK